MDMNKLPPGVREALRKRGREEAEVAIMTPREVFEDYCNWNGLINWSDTLWNTPHRPSVRLVRSVPSTRWASCRSRMLASRRRSLSY